MLEIKQEQIKSFSKSLPFCIVYGYTPKCPACQSFHPVIDAIRQKHPDILFRKINIFENEDWALDQKIEAIPHIAIYHYGECVGGGSGARPEAVEALVEHLKQEISASE